MKNRITKLIAALTVGVSLLGTFPYTLSDKIRLTAAAANYSEIDGYIYDTWKQDDYGSFEFENTENNGFHSTMHETTDALCLKGRKFEDKPAASDIPDYYVNYDADAYFDGNCILSVFGEDTENKIRFHIIDAWSGYKPSGNKQPAATAEIGGCTYELYDVFHADYDIGGSIIESTAYHDIISLRKDDQISDRKGTHLNSTVNIKDHIKAWEEAGFNIGNIDYVSLCIDSYRSNSELYVNYLDIGEEIKLPEPSQIERSIYNLSDKAEFSYDNFSKDSGNLKDSVISSVTFTPNSAAVSSCDELKKFLSDFLTENAVNKFTEKYSDSFFENNVLLLNTYVDPYKGRITEFLLNKIYYKDDKLYILFTSVIGPHIKNTYGLDIIQIALPKTEFRNTGEEWKNEEELCPETVRVSIVDEDTGKLIDLSNVAYSDLVQQERKTISTKSEGNNPYYVCDDYSIIDEYIRWPGLWINDEYLPERYMTDFKINHTSINNSADITIKVKNIAEGDVNGDNSFNIADIVAFQKWLINPSDEPLEYWKAADLYKDNILDVFDLCIMKRKLINK
ncbi:dockerin type I repeat-containing protein [Ruminococcus flavefaciens]|uniref:dockerin type I repeat-containing protein n=1 Tax=Ruminococcus flavefaciens TaxID=1265 RepID=UPI00048CE114|nr:glycoside hydrolase family 11 protein [Ruminococcus flavefaciens]